MRYLIRSLILFTVVSLFLSLTAASYNNNYYNINRFYEWYIDQRSTGPGRDVNCGPAVAVMAAAWFNEDFGFSVQEIREKITPNHEDVWTARNITDFFNTFEISYEVKHNVGIKNIIKELNKGNIIILCLNTEYIKINTDTESHYGKFYTSTAGGYNGHFLIVKGYFRNNEDSVFFEVYDPNSDGKTYADGSFKGKDRYYSGEELVKASVNWWNNYIIIQNPEI